MTDENDLSRKIDNIPQQLKGYPHWVCYRLIDKGESKLAKVPFDPKTGKPAKANNSKTWGTFDQACKVAKNGKYNGIGFEFYDDDPFTGVDLDHCVQDGVILPWAQKIIDRLNSYSELSPSGTGVHIYAEAIKPIGRCKKGDIEIYVKGRFLTITGNHINNTPLLIEKRQDEINDVHFSLLEDHSSRPSSGVNRKTDISLSISDAELINKAMSAKNGHEFKALWEGDISGFRSQSEADFSLCSRLAFWTRKDHGRMDSLFRQSGLMRPKWDKRHGEQTYGDMTISKAIEGCIEVYKGRGKGKGKKFNGLYSITQNIDDECPIEKNISIESSQSIIDDLNKKHAVLMVGGKCVVLNETYDYTFNRPDISFSSPTDFKNFYENRLTSIEDGNGNQKTVPIGKYWFKHPKRRQYDGITFAPLKETPDQFNLWKGFAVEPKKGDCSLILEHAKENISQCDEERYNYLIAWAADLIQNPAERPGTSIVLRGPQGVGKGVWASCLGSILGHHFIQVHHSRHLTGNFNAHLKDVLFVFADEAFWAGDKSAEGVLKSMVTEEFMQIEPKGKDPFRIKNYLHLMVASNNEWVVPAGLEERRFFILDVGTNHEQDHEYFRKIIDQMNNGGREALLYYLQHYDLSAVNLRSVPTTEALYETKLHSMTPFQKFWFMKLDAGAQLNGMDSWTEKPVSIQKFIEEYYEFAEKIGHRYKEDSHLIGIEIKRFVPDIRISKPYGEKGVRYRAYKFPQLEECRRYWGKLMKTDFEWPEEGTSLNAPSEGVLDEVPDF